MNRRNDVIATQGLAEVTPFDVVACGQVSNKSEIRRRVPRDTVFLPRTLVWIRDHRQALSLRVCPQVPALMEATSMVNW